ncbi:MAG: nitronate monooxygenase [Desulfobacteraceae bacterium]|nr:nitronate monooxygenase [Desulfobacteraceae bacterium]MBU4054320.1 nitronate monooxygenase [Pseudomonadota bacterium]
MNFENSLTKLLGVKYPIIQGAFGWPGTGTSDIAVPVAEAGGLGILTTICYKDPEEFQGDLKKAKELTDKPVSVNFTLMKDTKYTNDYHEEFIKMTLNQGIRTIFTSGYDGTAIGHRFKSAGVNWIHKCATIRHAVSAARKGVDAIVIVGLEGTGYKSPEQHTTLINITNLVKLVNVPVIAAGGIADARGFMGALAMGASGIYMGTAFMATKEFKVAEKFKQNIAKQNITDAKNAKKIYDMEHGGAASLASGVIDSVPTVKEFIDKIIGDANVLLDEMKDWGRFEE